MAEEGGDMRRIRRVFARQAYLALNRETVSFVPGASQEAVCVDAAGEYAFTGGSKARGPIRVNRLSDGAEVGTFDPGQTVSGVENTGWIDRLTGNTAFRRSNGDYLLFVEEYSNAKSLIYKLMP